MEYDVRFVANYLRKSRGEEETDLKNHRTILEDMCKKHDFKYVEYAEIGTSDSITERPKMSQLLKDVEGGVFDAVCVVDYDRLSRGDMGEQDTIAKAFKNSKTLIITPEKIYDLNNELDETIAEFKGFFARQEYRMIKKRLQQGKKLGARRGDWTNGKPPFPYEYQQYKDKYNEKGLVVNDEQNKLYREIIEMALNGMTPFKIAVDLNKRGVLTKQGNTWSVSVLNGLLLDETHLGKVISNKRKGDGHKNKKSKTNKITLLPKSEWVVVENRHEAVKTQEEHDIIAEMIANRTITPHRARKQTHAFSGLVRCGKCGHCHTFALDPRNKEKLMLKPCWYKDPYGNACRNGGIVFSVFEEMILDELRRYKDNFSVEEAKVEQVNVEALEKRITDNEAALKKYQGALSKVNDAYDMGDYDREEWLKRKKKWEDSIKETQDGIYELKKKLTAVPAISSAMRKQNIEEFFERITTTATNEELNDLYKTIIESITWLKDGKDISVRINYK